MVKKLDKISEGNLFVKEKSKQRSLSSLARLGIKGGPKDLSKNFDKYLVECIYPQK